MFYKLFLSKNQRLVKRWKKEHNDIVTLAYKVIGEHTKNNPKNTKILLKKLNILSVNHLMNEDIELYRLLKDSNRLTVENKMYIKNFKKTFKDTKKHVMHFLNKYTKEDAILDDDFFTGFNNLVEVLGERINFEEDNLYSILAD